MLTSPLLCIHRWQEMTNFVASHARLQACSTVDVSSYAPRGQRHLVEVQSSGTHASTLKMTTSAVSTFGDESRTSARTITPSRTGHT